MSFRVETVMLGPVTEQYAGVGRDDDDGIAAIARAASRLEELGFDGTTTPETGRDPFLPLVIAAEHTATISLGTNVAIAFPRSPMVTAQLAWDLQRLSRGRFRLGLGTQVKGHNERRYAAPWTARPGPRLREYLQCLKAMFASFQSGERPETFVGEHYRFDLLPPFFNPGPIEHPHVPIYLGVLNPWMSRLAGELADGLRLHPLATFPFTREAVLPAIAEGAALSGRTGDAIDVVGAPFLAVGRDEQGVEKAKAAIKQRISFYASTRTYHGVLRHHGWEDVGLELNRLSREDGWAKMPGLVSDEMLEHFAIVATWDELADRLHERCADAFDSLLLDLPPDLAAEEDRVQELVATLQAPPARARTA